jgi:hypothetical protein
MAFLTVRIIILSFERYICLTSCVLLKLFVISYSHNIINEPFIPSSKSLYIYVIYTSNSWILISINTMYSFLLYIWHSKIIRANAYTLSPVHYLIRGKYQLRFVTQHISNKLFVLSEPPLINDIKENIPKKSHFNATHAVIHSRGLWKYFIKIMKIPSWKYPMKIPSWK